ncbi:hypothetical protein Tco_0214864 [Tanacetum coccineum]
MQGASCTQRKVSMVPFVFSIPFVLSWGGSISFDSFLPSILLLVVIIVTVVIVVVILIVVVVVIVGVTFVCDHWFLAQNCVLLPAPSTSGMVKVFLQFEALKSWAYAFHQDKASSVRVPVANVTLSSSTHLLRENTDSVRSNQRMRPTAPFRTIKIGRYKGLRKSDGKRIIVIPDKDISQHTTGYRIDNFDIHNWYYETARFPRDWSLPSVHGMIIDESYLTLRSILHQRISWWWCKYTLTGDEDPTDSKTEYWNG